MTDIAINLLTTLLPQVRASGCRINMADVKLCIGESSLYYYPDLLYTTGDRVDLESLGISMAIEQLYTGINFDLS